MSTALPMDEGALAPAPDPAQPPDVTVIVAAWKAEATLARALRSALDQEGVTLEVILIDDASPDGTLALAQSLAAADPRLKVLAQAENAGPAVARNRGLAEARGRFVTILDADDWMDPGRLAALVARAEAGDWDVLADDLYKVASPEPGAPRSRLWSTTPLGTQEITFESFVRGNLSQLHGGRGELGFVKPLMRRAFLERHGLRYAEDMRLGEDYALYAEALARGARFGLTDPLGYVALTRPESLSGRHSAADLGGLVRADHRLAQHPGLSPGARRVLRQHEIETQKRWRWMWLIEAVKARDLGAILRCFRAPPPVILSLLGNLGEQVLLRSAALVRARVGRPSPGDGT